MVTDRLVEAGPAYEGARAFATPRRLALSVQGVPARQPRSQGEGRDRASGRPDGAIAGLLEKRGPGLNRCRPRSSKDPKKGDFYRRR